MENEIKKYENLPVFWGPTSSSYKSPDDYRREISWTEREIARIRREERTYEPGRFSLAIKLLTKGLLKLKTALIGTQIGIWDIRKQGAKDAYRYCKEYVDWYESSYHHELNKNYDDDRVRLKRAKAARAFHRGRFGGASYSMLNERVKRLLLKIYKNELRT